MKPEAQIEAMNGILIYATKYGSTQEYALLLVEKLGIEAVRASEAMPETILGADFLVLGSPIYAYSVLPEMEAFLEKHHQLLRGNTLFAFVVCGDTLWNPKSGEGGDKNLRKLTDRLPSKPEAVAVLGGRMIMDELDSEDGPRMSAFYERIGREAAGFDRMEFDKVEPFVDEIRWKVERLKVKGEGS
jgi:menaquinone-dependent protoporphyrinogen IX oxidase